MTSSAADVATRAVRAVRSALSSGGPPSGGHTASGWLAVTVVGDPSTLDPSAPPAPLAELGADIEVRVRPAPGGKGTELAARRRGRDGRAGAASRLGGQDPDADLRSALRRAKQLLEVGEVLAVDPAPHGERTATPGGALLESWTRAAPRAGAR